jgi:hypothetical protein
MMHLEFRIKELQEILSESAGIDPLADRYKAGYIRACKDILDIDIEE